MCSYDKITLVLVALLALVGSSSFGVNAVRVRPGKVQAVRGDELPSLVNASLPIVMWHGMGDNCCEPFSMGAIKKYLQDNLNGVYVKSLELGSSPADDSFNSFFLPCDKQIEQVCANVSADPMLANGFNAIGFSQGGQFLRALVQRCPTAKVHNLITMGGQHQGVYGMPKCLGQNYTLCNWMRELLNIGAYTAIVQDRLVQAQYWKDPLNIDEYLKYSKFLADINNERATKNATYKENLVKLNKFVMVKFTEDTMVQPRESEHFGEYVPGQAFKTLAYNETLLYKEDWIGLKTLDQAGKLAFFDVKGDHLQFSMPWFKENIFPFLTT